MTGPVIGITTYAPNAAGRYELPDPYAAAVRRAGGEAFFLPPGDADHTPDVEVLLGRLDGIVLAGGGDVDPDRYGGTGHDLVYGVHAGRDRDEIALVLAVLERRMPTLAICRGSQIVNVALGGTLIPHLPAVVDGSVEHRSAPEVEGGPSGPVPHPVVVDSDSRLAEVMGATEIIPMSWHHQAVDRSADGFAVVARASDGTVEATEHREHDRLLTVQWHPELTAAQDPTQQRLFDQLVAWSTGHREF